MRDKLFGKTSLAIIALFFSPMAYAGGDYELAKDARITMAQASDIVWRTLPRGVITHRELERDARGLHYSFDVTAQAQSFRVIVDAMTGDVIEARFADPNTD